ncbi:MAG: class B sortase [Lachnospiraceae bacterium]|nr:class B sortase [Lachnospiraceae bacterium]
MSRRLILAILYLTLAMILTVGGIWIYNDYQSKKNMDSLREAASTPEEDRGPEMTEIEKARFSHLSGDHERPSLPEDTTDVVEETPEEREILPRFRELYEQNPDLAGWLTIPGTKVDYPVMYLPDDNDFYLKHNFEKEDDVNGMLVLDKRCAGDGSGINSLIHGHHMKSGAMFGSLKYYTQKSYFEEHPVITFSSLYEERNFEIFAVFRSSVYNEETSDFQFFNYIDIEDEASFDDYVKGAKEQSYYDTGVDAVWGDRLITLSTCEYTKENGRLVIVARSE